MFVIFGFREEKIPGKLIDGYTCKNCGHCSHVSYGEIKRFHIFFLYLFPVEIKYFIECVKCKKTLNKNDMSEKLKSFVRPTVATNMVYAISFLGPIIVTVMAVTIYFI